MSFTDLVLNEEIEPSLTIYLKDKIDENIFGDILRKMGLYSIEIKNAEKSEIYYQFSLRDEKFASLFENIEDNPFVNMINPARMFSPLNSNKNTTSLIDILKNYQKSNFSFICGYIKLDAEKSCIYIGIDNYRGIDVISSMKEILFKEKILDEIYDKAKEYLKNPEKYEANIDNIVERVEENKKVETENETEEEKEEKKVSSYNLFIIKHFIKFVMDKYKEEVPANEDNSAKEDTKDTINNPFITDMEQKE